MAGIVDPWLVIDPAFRDPKLRGVAQAIITMVASGWTEIVPIDVSDPATLAVLDRHRISTLVPLEAVADDQREMYRERLLTIYGSQMRIQATAIDVLERLNTAGIESRVIKGLASAELDYPQMELRHTGDVDLAVLPERLDEAEALLHRNGYRGRPRPAKSPFVYKGATLDGPLGIEVDLHDRLFVRAYPDGVLLEGPGIGMMSLPGHAFPTELRLVNAAGAFAMTPNGNKRMSGLIDVHRILETHPVDLHVVRSLAERLRLSGPVAEVLRMEAACFSRTDVSYDDWPRVDWLDLQCRFGDRRRLVLEHVNRLRAVPLRKVPGYLPIWLTPDAKDRGVMRRRLRAQRKRMSSRVGR